MSIVDDLATLSKQIDLSATLAQEAVSEFGSSVTLAAQVEKLTADNAALTAQLQTATNDLATAQSQVADLATKQTANNNALASVLTTVAQV
ncbi:hypothetical protein FJ930_19685 [Mesorhizobium sp. B2-4-15]|uniref:hypothetical protein n=1 Tax=Mesorhizobium sp. B2-4-15 TaxID=2589934 RepID=UPI001150D55E|nr:hypothetical protein [Mesorhizobium sp. B2-4-15]TPK70192.1 hypothetical protein FJ930_19685 [Mesorhizobium sp. B2-4-15]